MSMTNNDILFKKFKILSTYKKNEHSGVYLADHIYLEKKVFLKILNTESIPDPSIITRFKREAKILAKLEHPNIIKVYDFGMYEEFFYISFEYFESKNLREFLREKSFSGENKKDIFVKIVQGLHYAHQNKIIHRDIKPENILVNSNFEVKLTDFGLAQDSIQNLITQQYSIVGTPAYMAPEQINGEMLTQKSDLFSLGITLIELFKNKNPFLGIDPNETINKILSFEESDNQVIFSDLPDEIKTIAKGLLAADPQNRFSSCSEILSILNIHVVQSVNKNTLYKKKWFYFVIILFAITLIIWNIFSLIQDKSQKVSKTIIPEIISDTSNLLINLNNNSKIEEFSTIKNDDSNKNKSNIEKNDLDDFTKEKLTSKISSESKKSGELFVKCYPWAKLYLNNEFIETTPLSKNIRKLSGKYLLTLSHPDYPKFSDSIEIKENDLAFVEVNLDTLCGYINCQVYPWAEIFINNTSKGITPLQETIKLAPGKHKIKLVNKKFASLEKEIYISKNDTLNIRINLESGEIDL